MASCSSSAPSLPSTPVDVNRCEPTRRSSRQAIPPRRSSSGVPPLAPGILRSNVGLKLSRASTTVVRGGLTEIEPDLVEDKRDRWATGGVSPEDFVYGKYDGHHTYFESGEKPSFWESLKQEYEAAEPPKGFQGLISWLFLPAVTLGLVYHVPDLRTRMKIGGGYEGPDALFYLDHLPKADRAAVASALSTSVSALQWHYRLGHPSSEKLQHVVSDVGSHSFQCESCQLGKQTRSVYPKRTHISSKNIFDLVHSDVWGPCHVPSLSGHKYFILFVDDFSRTTWLFMMKSRSEVMSTIKFFFAEVKTQYGMSVKVFRIDNALEFVQKDVVFLQICWYLALDLMCVYTSTKWSS